MLTVYDIKPKFQASLRPLTRKLAAKGITANQVTLAALALSVVTGALIASVHRTGVLLVLPPVLFVRMGLNAIDGMLAREHAQKSRLGALLNELGDVISDIALYLGFISHLDRDSAVLLIAVMLVAITGEMAGVLGIMIGANRRYDGPMGKSDRALAFSIFAAVIVLWQPAPAIVTGLLALILILGIWTVFNRCAKALAQATMP